MNVVAYSVEAVILLIAFTGMIMIPLCKDPVWWIHDFPKDIQEEYFKTHERVPAEPFSKTVLIKKGCALILALIVLVILVKLAGAKDFLTGFLYSYGLWSIINWYDCFFLDWVLFPNIKKVRLPGTEHMDKEYHQKWYHFRQALIGSVLGLAPCLLTGLIISLH